MRKRTLMGSLAVMAIGATTIFAADPVRQTEPVRQRDGVQVDRQRADKPSDGDAKSRHTGQIMRLEDVIGMEVHNAQGEEIGSVEEVVVDLDNGRVRYAALSFGGTLGFGEKLFAVPWSAIQVRRDVDDAEKNLVAFDITKQRLENAPGFDDDAWPSFADAKFTDTVDTYYRTKRNDQRVDNDKPARGRDRVSGKANVGVRTTLLKDTAVRDQAGKELGHVEELVFDMQGQGKVRYAALSYGGFLGLGDKLFAVPLSKLKFHPATDDEEQYFTTSISVETIKKADGFDQDNWPNIADPKWSSGIDKHYTTKTRRDTTPRERQ